MGALVMLMALQAGAVTSLPPEDAITRYELCVFRMASARAGHDPKDTTAEMSAIACDNLLSPAVDQVLAAASGNREDARRRISALLELKARREAVARNALVASYESEARGR